MKLLRYTIPIVLVCSSLFYCSPSKKDEVVEVVAKDFMFDVTDNIPSGWTTFRFINSGHAEHFFLLNLLPDSIAYETYVQKVTQPFQVVFDSLKAGKTREEAVGMLLELIPPWYFTDVKQMGGSGIVSKGKSLDVTLNLTPGTYAMECYIKEKGVFHTTLGMISRVVVTDEISETAPPSANMDITLSNFKIETEGTLKRGKNTFAVHFKEHPEVGLGNDVHIIKLDENTNIDSVAYWLDWMNIEGLQSPAPVEFLGGIQEMPVGMTGYFTVDLEPGDYAWIAESSASKGMIKRFSVE
jgi:hypothetical protein